MVKLKVLSGALSLAVLCSASIANAESTVVGQLVANPSAIVNAGVAELRVGSQASAYIEGDTITTGSDASASIALTSGSAKIVAAPNTVMAVTNASEGHFSLDQGAFSVQAIEGQQVTVSTSVGNFELNSPASIDAVASFVNGEFTAFSKGGLLTVSSQDGAVTSIDAGNAFVYNNQGASSLDVQAAGTAATNSGLNTALIIGGIVVTTAVVAGEISDDAGDNDEASPAE